jgi:benzoylformate decarboxylase
MAMTGADVVLDVLRTEGVAHIFGNPGTTELPLTDALAGSADIDYVLALQEASAAAMADGYARATGRPSFLNLHAAVGLGNAAGNLTNALANRSPIVVTAGQQDERHLADDPFLAGDLVGIARPLCKWAHEVRSPNELGTMLRRAFRDAQAPPSGPVFLALRMDHLQRDAPEAPPRSTVRRAAVATGLDELAARLCAVPAGHVALVLGDEVAHSGAVAAVADLADALGATAFGAPLFGTTLFAPAHPLWGGMLPLTRAEMHEVLAPFRVVLLLGADSFQAILYTPADPVSPETVVLQLSGDPLGLGRSFPVALGLQGDIRASVEALTPLVAGRTDAEAARAARETAQRRREAESGRWAAAARAGEDRQPMDPLAATAAIMSALPADTPLVSEAPTAGAFARIMHNACSAGTYFFARGGGLGWAMPAACGVALAVAPRPVICFVGDGSAMYSPQALWTAANRRLPILFVVMDNRGYAVLRETLEAWKGRSKQTGSYVALDLDEPRLDFCALAASMGVVASTVRSPREAHEAARAAVASGEPRLLHVPLRAAGDEA